VGIGKPELRNGRFFRFADASLIEHCERMVCKRGRKRGNPKTRGNCKSSDLFTSKFHCLKLLNFCLRRPSRDRMLFYNARNLDSFDSLRLASRVLLLFEPNGANQDPEFSQSCNSIMQFRTTWIFNLSANAGLPKDYYCCETVTKQSDCAS
jgi:hypothetical protein